MLYDLFDESAGETVEIQPANQYHPTTRRREIDLNHESSTAQNRASYDATFSVTRIRLTPLLTPSPAPTIRDTRNRYSRSPAWDLRPFMRRRCLASWG